MGVEVRGWRLTGPGRLERFSARAARPRAGQVLIEVAGCGVCHTDVGYFLGEVPTRRPNVVLGHEATGVVVDVADDSAAWLGRRVLVPAVWPCGECRPCRGGRATACAHALMPGSDVDGAFASHFEAPARWLVPVDGEARPPLDAPVGAAKLALWQLAPIADAVTTPLQAIRRAGAGELAIVVGVGGVGIFGVQLAREAGSVVAAVDVSPERLALAARLGATLTLDAAQGAKPIKAALKDLARARGLDGERWHVFEMSGTRAGQELAWSLLTRGGTISIVGFTPEAGTFRLSNLMALDATAFGNWGCDPALYPDALALVASGRVQLAEVVKAAPLDEAPRILEAVHRRELRERVVLVP